MANSEAAAVKFLQDLFPKADSKHLKNVLRRSDGDVEVAVEELLKDSEDDNSDTTSNSSGSIQSPRDEKVEMMNEKINQLREITQTDLPDHALESILQNCAFSVEVAVSILMDGGSVSRPPTTSMTPFARLQEQFPNTSAYTIQEALRQYPDVNAAYFYLTETNNTSSSNNQQEPMTFTPTRSKLPKCDGTCVAGDSPCLLHSSWVKQKPSSPTISRKPQYVPSWTDHESTAKDVSAGGSIYRQATRDAPTILPVREFASPVGVRKPPTVDDSSLKTSNQYHEQLSEMVSTRNVNYLAAAKYYQQGGPTGQAAAAFYSSQGRDVERERQQLRELYGRAKFRENNAHSDPNVIDLHGLHKDQAVTHTLEALARWVSRCRQSDGLSRRTFKIITGAGNHSSSRLPVLKNTIQSLLKREGYKYSQEGNGAVLGIRRSQMSSSTPSTPLGTIQSLPTSTISTPTTTTLGQADSLHDFVSVEGQYTLRDEIHDRELSASAYVGSYISFVTVKSTEHHAALIQSLEPPEVSSNSKYVEVPISGDGIPSDKGSFAFFRQTKPKKPVKPLTSKPGSGLFVAKIVAHEQLARALANRGVETTYMFYNVGKAFVWQDYSRHPPDALSKIFFKDAFVTCHDINLLTRDTMDVVIGFNTGDVMWYSPISGKYARLNRQGTINKEAVTCIKWIPGSESLFIAGHEDGSVIIYDKEKDDQPFSVSIDQNESNFFVSKPPKSHKFNPYTFWQVGRKPISALAFSPDLQHIAIVSMDGCLRIIDYEAERLYDTYKSYFGGLTSVAWSPDGKFILTGGQDDLVTIWAFRGRIVARCQGHHSWVSAVAFDAYKCTDRSYRFGSVGDDGRICLWDFSVSSLHRPRGVTMRRSRVDSERVVHHIHHAPPRSEVSMLEPSMVKVIHNEPICSLVFREDAIVTTDKQGYVKIWTRPPQTEPFLGF
ncbi:hypothetical protein SmJEL517_g04754 [Synchytrium microbalum]|uniref:Smr domain-containing protein n=1 Tax=Synchytrium microbalum TaxID=1806994 RepID=A0A507BYA4_9FUNG|nr:uncharacterized protein SmJEL517_g04754 [Synchytrium microbalum]TPX32091.1 hypothetical protein SmJEL517_g04754 [Synchytrium microbalum]